MLKHSGLGYFFLGWLLKCEKMTGTIPVERGDVPSVIKQPQLVTDWLVKAIIKIHHQTEAHNQQQSLQFDSPKFVSCQGELPARGPGHGHAESRKIMEQPRKTLGICKGLHIPVHLPLSPLQALCTHQVQSKSGGEPALPDRPANSRDANKKNKNK